MNQPGVTTRFFNVCGLVVQAVECGGSPQANMTKIEGSFDDMEFDDVEELPEGVAVDEFGEILDYELDDSMDVVDEKLNDVVDVEDVDNLTETSQGTIDSSNEGNGNDVDNCSSVNDELNQVLNDSEFIESNFAGASPPPKKFLKSDALSFRGCLSKCESEKEFLMFRNFVLLGGGRSIQYIAQIFNISITKLTKIAANNNWKQRAAIWDRDILAQQAAEATSARHQQHLAKLEAYRSEQEQLGKQLTLNAAKLATLANSKVTSMLENDEELDKRDLPLILNTAAKLAEVGRNIQSSALGVDQLLAALEDDN